MDVETTIGQRFILNFVPATNIKFYFFMYTYQGK